MGLKPTVEAILGGFLLEMRERGKKMGEDGMRGNKDKRESGKEYKR